MYNTRRLTAVAREGLSDLLPAMRQAFNDNPRDDRLELVYGRRPRRNIIVIALAGVLAGSLVALYAPDLPGIDAVNWPAVLVGASYAILIRRYLFASTHAAETDYPWLAASIAPAVALLMLISVVTRLSAALDADDTAASGVGQLLVAITDALGVAAALTIAVAALCFSRNWLRAIADLAVRLLVFRIMVWVTALVMLDIGVISQIAAGLLRGIFHIRIPEWLSDLVDQLSYAGLLCVVYLAVIGATWMACRRSFGELLATGQVNVLASIEAMARDPEKVAKKKAKQAAKAKKAADRQRDSQR